MFGVVDATRRPLKVPPKFIPYMEKHGIYELFQEMAKLLLIKKPDDHVLFLKQCLRYASRSRDGPKVILITPPNFDRMSLAKSLENALGIHVVTCKDLCEVTDINEVKDIEPEELAENMKKILQTGVMDYGWILVDIPRNKAEAQAFQHIGIIPTHVIQIIPDQFSTCRTKSNTAKSVSTDHLSPENDKMVVDQNLYDLTQIYSHQLIDIEMKGRSIDELAKDCSFLAQRKPLLNIPGVFRIVLFGSRGSGCRTAARCLVKSHNFVHADFNEIYERTKLQKTELGEILRMNNNGGGTTLAADIRIRIIERFLLGTDCLKYGWVLTGYPITIEDFKLLDLIATPPNRVIFVDVSEEECKRRIFSRRYNVHTGSQHNSSTFICCKCDDTNQNLAIHPRDSTHAVKQQIQEYKRNLRALRKYAGKTASIIDGNCDERALREKIESCLMKPAFRASLRNPGSIKPKLSPEEIEFDPYDEPDPRIFDSIREPEPKLFP